MNQIAGVDGFNLMNNLRLVIIIIIFIGIIIVLFSNRILGSLRRGKRKDMQAVNPSDDSSREERHAPDVVDDFFGTEESTEKEESKGDKSTAEPEAEIEDQSAVNYEKNEADLKAVRDEVITKIEADLRAVRDEVTTKIEGLILKGEAVENEVLNKIENVIDVKIQEASNKINDRISEVIRTQINSINPVSEERVDSLRKEEVPAGILPSEDMVVPEEIKEKEQTVTIVPSGEIEEEISGGDVGGSVDSDIQNVLEEEPVGMSSTEEPKELVEEKVEIEKKKERDLGALFKDRDIMEKFRLFVRYQLDAFDILPFDESKTVAEEKKERDLEVSSEVGKDVKVGEKESIEAITSTGEIEEKISEGDVGEPADFDIEKFLEEEPVGMASTEEPKESVEEKVEIENEKERDLEVPAEVEEDVRVDEKEPIEVNTSAGEVEEKISAGDVGESDDFDIQEFLEELGTPPSGKDLKSEKNDTD